MVITTLVTTGLGPTLVSGVSKIFHLSNLHNFVSHTQKIFNTFTKISSSVQSVGISLTTPIQVTLNVGIKAFSFCAARLGRSTKLFEEKFG